VLEAADCVFVERFELAGVLEHRIRPRRPIPGCKILLRLCSYFTSRAASQDSNLAENEMLTNRFPWSLMASAVAIVCLSALAGWADEWKGSYSNSRGDKKGDSIISFYKKGLSDGDWDGFAIFDLEISKDKSTRTWTHYAKIDDKSTKFYKVTAKKMGESFVVSYEVYRREVIKGKLAEARELLYKGTGTFMALPDKAE
jgi:hypothetical protein